MIQLNVPSIKCDGCAEAITNEIKSHDPNAKIDVDVENKIVKVETTVQETAVREMINSAGHTVS
ncbi:heavy metal transport/detoxification protein [Halothece sp. PCC 7418]|uniref:heavy-metal-associated domain-containing protein n=1 Tax=Halothece sp. (strain PCC 7418) TaxID=65093 RepID=UPI0002A075F4|nr:heavy-metal-associated domain-containing protein [Halothece sp. PCC 7418]AFZ43544.1 heavy metal transport/detoxification protein [Halothece sp. PCC 7418]